MQWLVMRQDDTGNRYVVASFATRAEAERERDALEARAHKQHYWIALAEADSPVGHAQHGRTRSD